MKIRFLGHACFYLESDSGVRIITDPYKRGAFGALHYEPVNEEADIVLISHDHADHNAINEVKGSPEVVKGAGEKEVKGIKIKGIDTYHDESQGRERGKNTMFLFEVDGIKVLHLGDLGHELTENELKEIGEIDIVLAPVGGYFTIDAEKAFKILQNLRPRVFIPMHFKNEKVEFPIKPVDIFFEIGKDYTKKEFPEGEFEIKRENLPEEIEIWFLKPVR